jgi:NAD(P)H-dependent flavin oxidoreductase YrpB (nitropropane dioxygenase family)
VKHLTQLPTRLTREYGVQHPIVAAGMAFVGTPPELAIAVCQAGGIGSIGAGPFPADEVKQLASAVRSETDRPFHVDFITPLTKEDQVDACISAGAPIASFHWGNPPQAIIDRLHTAGLKVWEQVGSVDSARRAVDHGVDLVVAQGIEAGGHNFSTLPTFVLVPAIAEAIEPCLLLAAGGVATGRQLAAALALGADGVWVGTRFVASEEAFTFALQATVSGRKVRRNQANLDLRSRSS